MADDVITSRDNPLIKSARRLLEPKGRRAHNGLLVEGVRLLRDAWDAGLRPEACFWDRRALGEETPGAGLVEEFAAAGVPCHECNTLVFATIADTVTPQGIAAVLPIPHIVQPEPVDFVLILDGVRDPGNAGTLLRSAEAAGVQLVLIAPESVDAWSPKVVRAGMGAHFRVALIECASWAELSHLLPAGMACRVAAMQAATSYDAVDWSQPSALVVGGEAAGASRHALEFCARVSIPMQGRVESLNAAMAGSIILFEAARQRRHTQLSEQERPAGRMT